MKKYQFQYSLPEMTRRLFGLAKPIRGYLTVSTLASILGNLAHMGLMGFGAMWILAVSGLASGSPYLYAVLAILSAAVIVLGRYLEVVFSHIGAYGILAKLRIRLFECLDRTAPAMMVDRKKGDLLNIAVSDIETLEFFFAHMIGPMFTVFLLPLTTLLIAGSRHMLYVAALLPVYLLISVIIPLLALKAGRRIGMKSRESQGELKSYILESVYGMRDLQIFGFGPAREAGMLRKNEEVNRAMHGLTMHKQVVSALPNFFVYLARILILMIAAYLAGLALNDPVGTILISFITTASFSSTFSLTSVVSNLLETYAAAERFFLIEDAAPAVREVSQPEDVGPLETIEFDDVTFSYPGTSTEILKGASFRLRQGEHVGIYGESGVGKSTLLRLLLRFYDPNKGAVRMNGTDLKKLSLKSLHKKIVMLEQETYLFDMSIAENIGISKPGAAREEIVRAAERAGIADFIATLPEGYKTQMGQMNARLSGGERQRIGIARILLADPDMIVMDEPTSSLDVLHEQELLRTLEKEYGGKTILIISHRMSTLESCERLVRMEAGQLQG